MKESLNNDYGYLYILPTVISEYTNADVLPTNYVPLITNLTHFLVEDIRTARRFLASLKANIIIDNLSFILLNKESKKEEINKFITDIKNGISFGILSEAGCPGIADPGAVAVKLAHENNIKVIPIVGPSAIFLGLMASGFNGQNFEFHGYLPIDKTERIKILLKLESESKLKNKTQIWIETPFRNESLFEDVLKNCHPNTHICIAKDLTGKNEMIKTKSIKEWKNLEIELHKTPTVFLLNALN